MSFIYSVLASLAIIFHLSSQQSGLPRLACIKPVIGGGDGGSGVVRPKTATNWKLGREMGFPSCKLGLQGWVKGRRKRGGTWVPGAAGRRMEPRQGLSPEDNGCVGGVH